MHFKLHSSHSLCVLGFLGKWGQMDCVFFNTQVWGFTVRPAQSVAARTEGSWWWREPWAKWAANASSTYLRLLVQGSAGASRRACSGASAARAGQSSTTMNYVPREKGQGEIETVKISPIELLPMISPLKSFLVIYFRGLLAQLCGPWKSRISLNLVPMDT